MSNASNDLYAFGEFRIDRRKGLLLHRGTPVAVPPKAYETLLALVESEGRVIGKDELLRKVWGETFVEENNLTQQISLLRKVLGDTDQKLIETVPRRGYRFAAEVVTAERKPPRRWIFPAAIAFAVAAAAIVAIFLTLRRDPHDLPRTIAVLPFKPLVAGSGDSYLELGMSDALITELSNIRQIRVRPTSAVIGYAKTTDPAAAGRELGVDAVLDGRIQRIDERVRVTAQLIRVADGAPLWAGKFDEDMRSIFAVQDAISARIVSALTLDLTGDEERSLRKRATRDAEAYDLYLRGRYHWFRWTPEGWERARGYFEEAVAKDPEFALAWCGLSDSIGVQLWIRPPKEVAPRVRAAASRALALDPKLADAWTSIAPLTFFHDFDRAEAERQIRRAIELNPNHALSHDLLALILVSAGRFDEALAESRRALALDPRSPYMNTDLGSIYYFRRDWDNAMKHLRAALAIDPNYADAYRYVAGIEEQRKNHPAAIEAWARMIELTGDPETAAAIRAALARGYESALRAWLDALSRKSQREYVSPTEFAELHARLGHRDEALTWLAKAKAERSPWMVWAAVEPRWDPYREDPRFRGAMP